jgi:hypothetical protein
VYQKVIQKDSTYFDTVLPLQSYELHPHYLRTLFRQPLALKIDASVLMEVPSHTTCFSPSASCRVDTLPLIVQKTLGHGGSLRLS